tara:strand:- start:781 stop:2391 length:1611 start_codon:yes stop_codon:yes gene_type:complete
MKKLATLALLSSSMLIAPPLLADTFSVEAPIKEVTVYKGGGAQITRVGKLTLPVGQHTLFLKNLHEELLSSDIPPHAVITTAQASISALKFQAQPSSNAASAPQQKLKAEIDAISLQISSLKDKISSNDMRLAFIKNIGNSQTNQPSGLDLTALQNTLNFVGKNTSDILADSQTHRQRINKLTLQQEALRRELARSGAPRTDYQQALLTVDNTKEQPVEFTFNYFVEDASWDMTVDASLDNENKQMNLALSAKISQETGENWEDVELSLSNARPSSFVGNIYVPSEFISIAPEQDMIRRMELKQQAPMAAAYEDIMVRGNRVSASSSRFDRKYQVAGNNTILSNGETETLRIADTTTEVEVITRAAPFFGGNAYVYADTTLSDFLSVRDINVTLTRDGHYAGTGRWPNLEANTALELPFGSDTNIEVTYKEQPPEDGDTGFIKKKSVEQKRFLITVTNNGTFAAPVEIFDRYPVAAHEDIKVTPLKTATKPDKSDLQNKPGVIKWKKTLIPGEIWHIKHEYQVSYPSDKSIRRSNK